MNTIVVGVDGSESSKEALRWALAEARMRGSRVLAVHAWSLPAVAAYAYMPSEAFDLELLRTSAEERLEAIVAETRDAGAGVEVEQLAVNGLPSKILVEAAEDAEMLVVGSRGHGGFTGLLLGSVSQQCAHHAQCPVVIVRGPRDGAGS
jgi:nucleotide-binding universal stress UspA family protein